MKELALCYRFSRQLLKMYSKSFYISTMLLPRNKRKAVFALYGFCRYADNLVDKPRDRSQAEILREVDYMSEELKVAYRTGESEHPVLCAFSRVAREYRIPIEYPLDLFRGVAMDIEHHQYRDFEDLRLFCYRVAGVVGLMMTHVLGYLREEAFEYAAKLGIAMQLTNILRDIQEDKRNGRLYLPLDEMHRFQVTHRDLAQEQFTPELKQLIRFSAERAHRYYDEANPGIQLLTPDCRFSIRSASDIYRGILSQIENNDYNPFLGRVYVTQNAKLKIILFNYLRGWANRLTIREAAEVNQPAGGL